MITESFLGSQKKLIQARIEQLRGGLKPNGGFSELGSSDDENVQEFEAFEEGIALKKNAQRELSELSRALKLIENKEYGRCEVCNQEIETGRLKAYPAARTCVTHAK